ncbi:MAG: hypothetical protein HZB82_09660 [Deltaproteobacteria bacterium]|nr:hypothetical protein [Deltaproteobacteria bacterium]
MKMKLWQKCVIVFIAFHWALFLVTYFILQTEIDVPQFVMNALELPLIPFLLTSLALKHMPLSPGGALERAVAIIMPTIFYAVMGIAAGLIIEKRRRSGEKQRLTR